MGSGGRGGTDRLVVLVALDELRRHPVERAAARHQLRLLRRQRHHRRRLLQPRPPARSATQLGRRAGGGWATHLLPREPEVRDLQDRLVVPPPGRILRRRHRLCQQQVRGLEVAVDHLAGVTQAVSRRGRAGGGKGRGRAAGAPGRRSRAGGRGGRPWPRRRRRPSCVSGRWSAASAGRRAPRPAPRPARARGRCYTAITRTIVSQIGLSDT